MSAGLVLLGDNRTGPAASSPAASQREPDIPGTAFLGGPLVGGWRLSGETLCVSGGVWVQVVHACYLCPVQPTERRCALGKEERV